jgi:hypothetical protein
LLRWNIVTGQAAGNADGNSVKCLFVLTQAAVLRSASTPLIERMKALKAIGEVRLDAPLTVARTACLQAESSTEIVELSSACGVCTG